MRGMGSCEEGRSSFAISLFGCARRATNSVFTLPLVGRVARTQASLRSLRRLGCAARGVGVIVVARVASANSDPPPLPTPPPAGLRACPLPADLKVTKPRQAGVWLGREQTECAARCVPTPYSCLAISLPQPISQARSATAAASASAARRKPRGGAGAFKSGACGAGEAGSGDGAGRPTSGGGAMSTSAA